MSTSEHDSQPLLNIAIDSVLRVEQAEQQSRRDAKKQKKRRQSKKKKKGGDNGPPETTSDFLDDDQVLTDTDGYTSITFKCGDHLRNQPAARSFDMLFKYAAEEREQEGYRAGCFDAQLLAWQGPFCVLQVKASPGGERSWYFLYYHNTQLPLSSAGISPAVGPVNLASDAELRTFKLVAVEPMYPSDDRFKGKGVRSPFLTLAALHEKALTATGQAVPAEAARQARQRDKEWRKEAEARQKADASFGDDASLDAVMAANMELITPSISMYANSKERLVKGTMFVVIKARINSALRTEIYLQTVGAILQYTAELAAAPPAARGPAFSRLRRAWELLAIYAPFFAPNPFGLVVLLQFLRWHVVHYDPSLGGDELPAPVGDAALLNEADDDLLLEDDVDSYFRDDDGESEAPLQPATSAAASAPGIAPELAADSANPLRMAAEFGLFIVRRLRRLVERGPREASITPSEFVATVKRRHTRLRVHLLDGTCVLLLTDSSTTVSELVAELVERIGLQESRGWALYEIQTLYDHVMERSLPKNEKILDELWKLEAASRTTDISTEEGVDYKPVASSSRSTAAATPSAPSPVSSSSSSSNPSIADEFDAGAESDDRLLPSQLLRASQTILTFRRKLFLNPRAAPDKQVEANLLAYQAREQFLVGKFPCGADDSLRFAALLFHYEQCLAFSTDRSHRTLDELDLSSCIAKTVIQSSLISDAEWKTRLQAEYARLGSKDDTEAPSAALLRFFAAMQEHPLYGAEYFKVSHRSSWSLPGVFHLGVGLDGVKFVDGQNGAVIFSHPHAEMVWNGELNKLHLYFLATPSSLQSRPVKGLSSLTISSDDALEIGSLLKDYQNWLRLYSTVCVAARQHPTDADYRMLADKEGITDDAKVLHFNAKQLVKITQRCNRYRFIGELPDGSTGSFLTRAVRVRVPLHTSSPGAVGWIIPPTPRSARRERSATHNTREESRFKTQLVALSEELGQSFRLVDFARDNFRPAPPSAASSSSSSSSAAQQDSAATGGKEKQGFRARMFGRSKTAPAAATAASGSAAAAEPYDLNERSRYQARPLDASLTKLDTAELNKTAVAAFVRLLKWLGAASLDKNETAVSCLQDFIETLVYTEHPQLVTELYCQVMKQCIQAPDDDVTVKSWQAFVSMISCRLPPDALRRYMFGHIQQHAGVPLLAHWANLAKRAIGRNLHRGPRKGCPSAFELQLLVDSALVQASGGASEFYLAVKIGDGTQREVPVDASCTVSEVIDQLCALLDFAPTYPEAWTLYHTCKPLRINRPLSENDFVFDEIRRAELHIVAKGTQRPAAEDWAFVLRCRFFVGNPTVPPVTVGKRDDPAAVDDTELRLIYHGAFGDVWTGTHVLDTELLYRIAANHVLVTRFEAPDEPLSAEDLQHFLPKRWLSGQQSHAAVLQQLQATVQTQRQQLPAGVRDIMQDSLQQLVRLPLFGASVWPIHRAVRVKKQMEAQACVLCINGNGVHIVERLTRKPIQYFPWHHIRKWNMVARNFSIKLQIFGPDQAAPVVLNIQPRTRYAAKQIIQVMDQYVRFLVARAAEENMADEVEASKLGPEDSFTAASSAVVRADEDESSSSDDD